MKFFFPKAQAARLSSRPALSPSPTPLHPPKPPSSPRRVPRPPPLNLTPLAPVLWCHSLKLSQLITTLTRPPSTPASDASPPLKSKCQPFVASWKPSPPRLSSQLTTYGSRFDRTFLTPFSQTLRSALMVFQQICSPLSVFFTTCAALSTPILESCFSEFKIPNNISASHTLLAPQPTTLPEPA